MRITPTLLLLITLRAFAADPTPAPSTPAFWLDRAARDVAAAKDVVEYDGPFPRVTVFEAAADVYRAAPTPANHKLLEDKLTAGEAQLDAATQPWRRWYGRLILARVYRAALQDDAAYRRHLAAADALAKFLPNRDRDTPLYRIVRGAEFAAAGDAPALRNECAAATGPSPPNVALFAWYARVASRCIDLGHVDGARAALEQLAADASVPSAATDRPIADDLLALEYSRIGDDASALESLARLDGPRRFDVALRLFRTARLNGRTEVTKKIQASLANVLPPTFGPAAGAYVAELATAGDREAARETGRAALKRGPAGDLGAFYAALAGGLFAADDRETAAAAMTTAREAIDQTTANPDIHAAGLLTLAAAHARAGDFDAMTTTAAQAAKIENVHDSIIAGDRGRLIETLVDLRRWDDIPRQLAPIRAKPDRDAWMPRIVVAQVRAGATDLAVANAKSLDGFIRARCVRAIAIERAKRNDLDTLPAWVDQQDTPLRRAATNLAVAQVLAKQPTVSAGFPPDQD